MFWQLFLKELKYHLKSITYYIFIAVVVMFYVSQALIPKSIDDIKPLTKEEIQEKVNKLPLKKRDIAEANYYNSYGYKSITDIKMKQQTMYDCMYNELFDKKARTYKFGFLKKLKLSNKQVSVYKDAMEKINPEKKISEEDFIEVLNKVDKAIGGSSYYSEKYREIYLKTMKTYEEAMERYYIELKDDKITNTEGRVLADYMGITAGLFPIFIAAFILIRDMKSGSEQVIFSKKIGSLKYIITKYIAAMVAFLIPYLIIATHETFAYAQIAINNDITIDYFAFYKYILAWVVPTLMFVTALGMISAVLFKKPIVAIIIQFLLWCISISDVYGNYGLSRIIIRYSSNDINIEYMKWAGSIAVNRSFYFLLSVLIILLTVFIYNRRRGTVGEKLNLL